MRYAILLLATLMTFVAARSIQLKQATRDEIAKRMASPVHRRQSLPSAGVYPTCAGSLPRGTGNSMITSIVIGYSTGGSPLTTPGSTSNQQCADFCLANPNCGAANQVPPGNFCQLRTASSAYNANPNFNGITPGRTCLEAQALIGAAVPCCDYITLARG